MPRRIKPVLDNNGAPTKSGVQKKNCASYLDNNGYMLSYI